jgi:hypothetical protein
MKTVPEILRDGAATYEERNEIYGDNYKNFGKLFLSLFPDGEIPLVSNAQDAVRLNLIMMVAAKLQRYAYNFDNGGHLDSAHDMIVYAAMLEEMTK